MIESIEYGSLQLALIIRRSFKKDGIEFFTPGAYSQQLGYMNRPAGYVIPPHVHNPVARQVEYTKKVLFEMLAPTEMIEVKQGPYVGDQDKTRFDPVSPEQLRLY